MMKVYNYTVIESAVSYYKYARENYGMKKRNDSMTEEEVKGTDYGKRMFAESFPLRFYQPL